MGFFRCRLEQSSGPAGGVPHVCNHCPYVKHIRDRFAEVAKDYQKRGVAVVGINSNDVVNHPDDSPEKMAEEIRDAGYTFPYLFDEDQSVAKSYHAACTPDFFLFDRDRKLVYRGQFDDSRPRSGRPVTGADLTAAVDSVLAGRAIPAEQRPSARLQHQVESRKRLDRMPPLPATVSLTPHAALGFWPRSARSCWACSLDSPLPASRPRRRQAQTWPLPGPLKPTKATSSARPFF